jgi:hypothetical protein
MVVKYQVSFMHGVLASPRRMCLSPVGLNGVTVRSIAALPDHQAAFGPADSCAPTTSPDPASPPPAAPCCGGDRGGKNIGCPSEGPPVALSQAHVSRGAGRRRREERSLPEDPPSAGAPGWCAALSGAAVCLRRHGGRVAPDLGVDVSGAAGGRRGVAGPPLGRGHGPGSPEPGGQTAMAYDQNSVRERRVRTSRTRCDGAGQRR